MRRGPGAACNGSTPLRSWWGPPISFDKQKENRTAHLLPCQLHALPSTACAPVVQVKQAA